MSREEANKRAQLADAHQEKHKPGEDRADRKGKNRSGEHGFGVALEEFRDEEDRKWKMQLRGGPKRDEAAAEEKGGKLYRPVGQAGKLAWHRI